MAFAKHHHFKIKSAMRVDWEMNRFIQQFTLKYLLEMPIKIWKERHFQQLLQYPRLELKSNLKKNGFIEGKTASEIEASGNQNLISL